jgi:hypothetical protein
MSQAFGGTFLGPVDAHLIIIVDRICSRHENLLDTEEFIDLDKFQKELHTFISCIYLRFC